MAMLMRFGARSDELRHVRAPFSAAASRYAAPNAATGMEEEYFTH